MHLSLPPEPFPSPLSPFLSFLPPIPPPLSHARGKRAFQTLRHRWPQHRCPDTLCHHLRQILLHRDAPLKFPAFAPFEALGVFVSRLLQHVRECRAREPELFLVLVVEFGAEGRGKAADHVTSGAWIEVLAQREAGWPPEDVVGKLRVASCVA